MNWWLQIILLLPKNLLNRPKKKQTIGLNRNVFLRSEKQQKILYKPLVQDRIHVKITYGFFALFDA